MRHGFLAGVIWVVLTLGAWAQEGGIEDTIDSQLDAFKADDFATAFTYATPGLRNYFRTPENFGQMVTQGYPMVWRPGDVRYLQAETRGAFVLQTVQITDLEGRMHLLEYRMVETPEGWRIAGVRLLGSVDPSV